MLGGQSTATDEQARRGRARWQGSERRAVIMDLAAGDRVDLRVCACNENGSGDFSRLPSCLAPLAAVSKGRPLLRYG
jgi:hypothetical protein